MAAQAKEKVRKVIALYPLTDTSSNKEDECKKLRAAAYCRVSTGSVEQLNSYFAQIDYYKTYLTNHSEYEFVEIFADEGISGTSLKGRNEFKRMMDDCRAGLIDVIITKSVSRFGRNTLDTLNNVRELRALGIDVFFEKENIHTMRSEGEILLTLISAVAESESYNLSENIKWGKRRRYELGDIHSVSGRPCIGYVKNPDGDLIINEQQAKIIRRIFNEYLCGFGYQSIVDNLNNDKVPTVWTAKKWTTFIILSVINNEKIRGDVRFQKSFISDPLTKNNIVNNGELPQYYAAGTHTAIIDSDTWDLYQLEHKRRIEFCKDHHYGRLNARTPEYPFDGHIVCGVCGCMYGRSQSYQTVDYGSPLWRCRSKKVNEFKGKKLTCHEIRLPIDAPEKAFISAWNQLVENYESYVPIWEDIIQNSTDALLRYRAADIIELVKGTGRIDRVDYRLVFRTLDHILVGVDGGLEVVFLSGTRVRNFI